MALTNDAWTNTHDLSLIFIALAYGTDCDLSRDEQKVIVSALEEWQDRFPAEAAEEIVVEALVIYDKVDNVTPEVIRSMQNLKERLSEDEREQALQQVVRIAEADGVLLNSERSLITSLASVWELKETGQDLLAHVTAREEAPPEWSLMHDIALMYVVVAHSSDDELHEDEIASIIHCFREWQPYVPEQGIRDVLRDVLTYYANGPEQQTLEESARAILNQMSTGQRLAVLADLVTIAEADGTVNRFEREMISVLARAWMVGVQFDGDAFVTTNGKA